jgi:hypothetical protein
VVWYRELKNPSPEPEFFSTLSIQKINVMKIQQPVPLQRGLVQRAEESVTRAGILQHPINQFKRLMLLQFSSRLPSRVVWYSELKNPSPEPEFFSTLSMQEINVMIVYASLFLSRIVWSTIS